jgi:hypothetical protein
LKKIFLESLHWYLPWLFKYIQCMFEQKQVLLEQIVKEMNMSLLELVKTLWLHYNSLAKCKLIFRYGCIWSNTFICRESPKTENTRPFPIIICHLNTSYFTVWVENLKSLQESSPVILCFYCFTCLSKIISLGILNHSHTSPKIKIDGLIKD